MNNISCNNKLLNYFSLEDLKYISELDNLYLKSVLIVTKVFEKKMDESGKAYINHLLRVSNSLYSITEKVSALFHDILEDTEVTEIDLFEVGIPSEVINIVKLLTHKEIDKTNMTKEQRIKIYNEEIDSILASGNKSAIKIKELDMLDNYDSDRLKELSKEQQEWLCEKYENQLVKLKKVKGDIK